MLKFSKTINDLKWNEGTHPLMKRNFFKLLEESQVIGTKESGWFPVYCENEAASEASFIKTHSYGEFFFDFAWADFYHQNQLSYYPKLVTAIPFSPVFAKKFNFDHNHELFFQLHDYYQNEKVLSGHHILFDEDDGFYESQGYFRQKSIQFHFINKFSSFDDYLNSLKTKKRKSFLKERKAVAGYHLKIKKVEASKWDDLLIDRGP